MAAAASTTSPASKTSASSPFPPRNATKWRLGQHFRSIINASSSDRDPKATEPGTKERDERLGVWNSSPHWTLTYTSPDKGVFDQGNQQRVNTTVFMDLTASSPNAAPLTGRVDNFHSTVRYDSAGRIAGKAKGTVFTGARVVAAKTRRPSCRGVGAARPSPRRCTGVAVDLVVIRFQPRRVSPMPEPGATS